MPSNSNLAAFFPLAAHELEKSYTGEFCNSYFLVEIFILDSFFMYICVCALLLPLLLPLLLLPCLLISWGPVSSLLASSSSSCVCRTCNESVKLPCAAGVGAATAATAGTPVFVRTSLCLWASLRGSIAGQTVFTEAERNSYQKKAPSNYPNWWLSVSWQETTICADKKREVIYSCRNKKENSMDQLIDFGMLFSPAKVGVTEIEIVLKSNPDCAVKCIE